MIQRWCLICERGKCVPYKADEGRHVLYADHQQALSALEEQLAELRKRYAFFENQRLCKGYVGGCDGDLEATEHDENCPARPLDLTLRPHLYVPTDPVPTDELPVIIREVSHEELALGASLTAAQARITELEKALHGISNSANGDFEHDGAQISDMRQIARAALSPKEPK
jgi:hypothetical protein